MGTSSRICSLYDLAIFWRKCIKMHQNAMQNANRNPQTWPTGKYTKYTMPKDFPGAAVRLYVLRHLFPYLIYLHVCHCCSIYLSSYLDIDRSTVDSEWNVCKTWHHQSPVICNMFQAALYTCFMTFRGEHQQELTCCVCFPSVVLFFGHHVNIWLCWTNSGTGFKPIL